MANPEQLRLDALAAAEMVKRHGGSKTRAAEALGIPRSTLNDRLRWVERHTPISSLPADPDASRLEAAHSEIAVLTARLREAQKEQISSAQIKREIFKLVDATPGQPDWLINRAEGADHIPGVPTIFASDWHLGEVVDPGQVNFKNEFNLDIAETRARSLIERSIYLLRNHVVNPTYPGVVFALGGDMVSGDIHEELARTNEVASMPTMIELVRILRWSIATLADEFGNVFIPCVSGNHGRNTHKIYAKGRNFTNFDWLAYRILEMIFREDPRVTFEIPDGPDCLYRVYSHRYLLTHGDQFRGGDGISGAIMPIVRGDHKKRSRNAQIDMNYDTMIMGHWHQWFMLRRVIVNGSLKGYDEYAYSNNFPYEPATQGLWLTHPKRGITFPMPVQLQDMPVNANTPWVSVRA